MQLECMQNPTTSGKQRIRSAYGDCPYYVIIAGGKDCILRVFWGHSWIEGKRGDEDDLPQTWCPDACDTNMTQAWILCLTETMCSQHGCRTLDIYWYISRLIKTCGRS